jgi:hypothetical protein
MIRKSANIVILVLALTACSTEKFYRGVPDTEWRQLTPEQKQLIIDRSFKDDTKQGLK